MNTPRKPLWARGLALLPQHFQFQDRYHEDLVGFRLGALVDHGFGLVDLQIDEPALARGEVKIERATALFPDGTVVDVRENSVPTRALDPNVREAVDLFLGITKQGAERSGTLPPRLVTERTRVQDQVTGLSPVEVDWVRPYPVILLSTDNLAAFDVLPIGRVVRGPGQEFVLSPEFIPPTLRVRGASALYVGLRRVRHALTAALGAIAAQRQRAKELDGPAALRLMLAGFLSESASRLADPLERPSVRPLDAYEVLTQLVGTLSAFDPSIRLDTLPSYQHTDLAATFTPLVQMAVRTLGFLAASRFVQIPLRSTNPSLHFADLVEPAMFRYEFYVALSGADEARLRETIPQVLKIAAWEAMEELVRSAASGVRVAHEHRPPPVLPLRPGVVYFRIERAGAHWENIVRRGNLTILQPHESANVKVELFAVEPEGGA